MELSVSDIYNSENISFFNKITKFLIAIYSIKFIVIRRMISNIPTKEITKR